VPELSASDFMEKIDASQYSWIHMEARKNASEIVKMIRFAISSAAASGTTLKMSIEIEKPSKSREVYFTEDIDYYFISKDYAKWKGANDSSQSIEVVAKMFPKDRTVVIICAWAEMGARAAVVECGRITTQFSSPAFTPRTGVIDTTGAGDSFVGATVFALQVLQYDPGQAITFGCRFAGAKCGVMGNNGLEHFEQLL
jgi:sugar/nucleoside kinase (ribokinase family)